MNPKPAAQKMERLIMERWPEMDTLPLRDYEVGINHLQYMCQRIYNGSVSGDKAVLWLWVYPGRCEGCWRGYGG